MIDVYILSIMICTLQPVTLAMDCRTTQTLNRPLAQEICHNIGQTITERLLENTPSAIIGAYECCPLDNSPTLKKCKAIIVHKPKEKLENRNEP